MLGHQDEEQSKPVSGPFSGAQDAPGLPKENAGDRAVDSQWSSSSQCGEVAAALTAEEKAAVAALLFRKGLLQVEGASTDLKPSLERKTSGGKNDDRNQT